MAKKQVTEGTATPGEAYKPMGVSEPTDQERIAALEIRINLLEKKVGDHHVYHFGRV